MVAVNILEICYDGELRLRDGFDENQGRVEICFDGVWGTVCHNRWSETDSQVVCRQLGLLSPSKRASHRHVAAGQGCNMVSYST